MSRIDKTAIEWVFVRQKGHGAKTKAKAMDPALPLVYR